MGKTALKSSSINHCLYITYDGLLDPLGSSQILPYLVGLSNAGYRFTVLSFEKPDRDPLLFDTLHRKLRRDGIAWVHLPFESGRFQGVLRILRGASQIRKIAKKDPFAIVHMRAIVSAVVYKLAFVRRPFIYDIRAFLGQWVDGGRLSANSIAYRFLSWLEGRLIRDAAGLVILDQSGREHLLATYKNLPPVKIIPTSTDLIGPNSEQFFERSHKSFEIHFVFLGGASFPYLPVEALKFVKSLLLFGFNCAIDFINERDHALVSQAFQLVGFPKERFQLFSLTPEEVQIRLPSYDCGLVFIAEGPWISMSSPTKIGEYLAAGLHVIGLRGIQVLERLAAEASCVDVLNRDEHGCQISAQHAHELVACIKSLSRPADARKLAKQHYSRSKAVAEYIELYQQVLHFR